MVKTNEQLIAEHQALLNAAVDGIIVIDKHGHIESFNSAAQNMFGYDEAEVEGLNVNVLMPEPHKAMHDSYMHNYLESGEAKIIGIGREVKAKHKNGTLFPIHLSVGLFHVEQSPKFVGIVHDLTEQKRKELALKQARDEARQHRERLAHVDRLSSMGEMAAGIAHEINQPLAAITAYSAGVQRLLDAGNYEPQELHSAVDRIAEQAHRAGEIIKRIRQFSKKDGEYVWVDPNQLIHDIAKIVEIDSRKSGMVLVMDLQAELPKIKVDPVQIQQVLLNLVRNAFEAMIAHEGSGNEITVSTRMLDNGRVEFSVQDQGPGVGGQEEDVFAPFYSTKSEGMGMGLSISSTIVRAHNGSLGFRANPDLGVTFYFDIPLIEGVE